MAKLVIIITVVLGAGIAAWSYFRQPPASAALHYGKDATARVERGNMHVSLLAEGDISARESVWLSHAIPGMLVVTRIIEEGTQVQKDAELVVFDGAKQKHEVEAAEAECKTAATEVEIAQKAVEIAERENAESLATAKFKFDAAKLELEKVEKGEMPQTERKMLLEIERWDSEVKQTKEAYDSITDKEVLAQGFVTPAEIEKERLRYSTAQIQAEFSKSELSVFRKYTRPVALNEKRASVLTTEASIKMIESVNANKLRQKNAELEAKQEKKRQVQARLEDAKKNFAGTIIKAPSAGMALYGNSNYCRVGGQVYTNQPVIMLPNLSELVVRTSVAEADINKVKEGMHAIVTSVAYPGMREIATVTKTGNVSTRNFVDAANQYEVTVQLRAGITGIRPGVSTKVEIEVEDLTDVLKIPVSAVFIVDGRDTVFTADRRAHQVKLGSSNDTHVAVLEGLKEGETILLYEPENKEAGKTLPDASNPK